MIIEYHRPETIAEAVQLLKRSEPLTLPLGGGTLISRRGQNPAEQIAVVDVQCLGLGEIRVEGQLLLIGAAVTLQQIFEYPGTPDALRESIRLEAGLNQRQMKTAAGAVVSGGGRSTFLTALLALDPRLEWAEEPNQQPLGDYLSLRPADPFQAASKGRLMVSIRVLLNASLRFASVARSPLDLPVVCAAAAKWPSGRTRLALGGWSKAPILAMDGPEPGGIEHAARSAYLTAGDEWASAPYRADAAAKLARRLALELAGVPVEGEPDENRSDH